MRRSIFNPTLVSSVLSGAMAIAVLASAPAAAAQSSSTTVKVSIPFAFVSGSQSLPAGIYDIDLMSNHLMLLRGPGKSAARFVQAHSVESLQRPSNGSVVFDRYGSRNYLRQVWAAGDTQGRECAKSRAEKETQRASADQQPTLVQLALIR